MVALSGLGLKDDGKMGGYFAAMLQKGQRVEAMVYRNVFRTLYVAVAGIYMTDYI